MTPPPSFSFEQALALLQSGEYRCIPHSATANHQSSQNFSPSRQHGSSPLQTTSRTRSSGITDSSPPSVLTFQDALAILQRGEHRNNSHVAAMQAMSHQATPSTHRQNTTYSATATQQALPHASDQSTLHGLSPSHTRSQQRSRPTPTSISTPTPRSSYRESSEPIVPISYEQALAMLQHAELGTSSVAMPYGTSHQQARSSSMHHQNTLSTNRHATMRRDRRRSMPSETRIEQLGPSSTFQEALARLHSTAARSHHQTTHSSSHPHNTHTAARQVRSNGEGPIPVSTTTLSDDIQRHRRPLHQEATAPAAFQEANHNYANVADRRLHHREVLHMSEAHRQQSSESDPSMKLANLPSLSFEEACKTINWRSATKMEGANCGICLDDFDSEDKVHLFPNCNHLFHVDCVKDWLLKVGSCPCCRDTIIDIKNSAPE